MFKKALLSVIIFLVLLLTSAKSAHAISDPNSVPNNPFGIHIIDENDLEDAANLVNSEGGDFGYVTFVIKKTERDTARWQEVFNKARRLHLIPIVRIATQLDGSNWEKPSLGDIDGWVSFLNSLNWVIKNRYVIIANEPNHAKEWGGEVNPEEYAVYLKEFSQKLKASSDDFFILPAGLDASAPNSSETMDETKFVQRMLISKPDIFDNIDGWTSHSYPNPGFSGNETDTGRGTVKTFDWELGYLKSLGVTKELPVFITETGWSHDMGESIKLKRGQKKPISINDVGKKLTYAYQSVWNDKRIVVVTPFVLNYQETPFDVFSWKAKDGSFYDFYYQIQKLDKTKGEPQQINSSDILAYFASPIQFSNSSFKAIIFLRNTGQSIWKFNDIVVSLSDLGQAEVTRVSKDIVEPDNIVFVVFRGPTSKTTGISYEYVSFFNNQYSISKTVKYPVITIGSDFVDMLLMKIASFFDRIRALFRL
jgi:hypothetical protein